MSAADKGSGAEAARVAKIVSLLKKNYPEARTALTHRDPFQLLIATILSAQCTDDCVNKVTPVLFKKFPGPSELGAAPLKDLETIIHSTGFYHNKALSIKEASRALAEKFGGKVPADMDQLLTLRGVARKTANVVLGSGFGIAAGVVVDTHVKRLSFRLGFTAETDPAKVEKDLMAKVARKDWIWFSLAVILHGRAICHARDPRCGDCPLNRLCPKNGVAV